MVVPFFSCFVIVKAPPATSGRAASTLYFFRSLPLFPRCCSQTCFGRVEKCWGCGSTGPPRRLVGHDERLRVGSGALLHVGEERSEAGRRALRILHDRVAGPGAVL